MWLPVHGVTGSRIIVVIRSIKKKKKKWYILTVNFRGNTWLWLCITGKKRTAVRKCATPGVGRSKYGGEGPLFDMSSLGLSTGVQQDLEEAARHSLARKTWATYNTAERMLEKFCKDKGHKLVWPLQESTLLNFIHWLAYDRGVSAATINGYLAGVRKIHVMRGFPEPQFRTQLVKMVLEGRKNMEAADRLRRRAKGRQPVTIDILFCSSSLPLAPMAKTY
jgi:Phage integrase SAM-like domain